MQEGIIKPDTPHDGSHSIIQQSQAKKKQYQFTFISRDS
jgi:hypothetical protein